MDNLASEIAIINSRNGWVVTVCDSDRPKKQVHMGGMFTGQSFDSQKKHWILQNSNISSPLAVSTTTSGNSQNNNNDDSGKQPQPRQKQTGVESRLPKRWGWCSEHFRRETAISEGAYLF